MPTIAEVHVLIVDDNQQMRMLTRALLRAAGILQISEAEGAKEAFAIMTAREVDLLLLDWRMQPMDGLTFTRMVRKDGPNPYVPILMMTAHTEMSRVAAARDAGVSGFVKKPISGRILFDRISSALTDQRMFVRAGEFFGPDRRRSQAIDYAGPFRRSSDTQSEQLDTFDLDDPQQRWRA